MQKEVAETASKKVPAKNSTSSLNHARKNKFHEIILSNLPSRPGRIRPGESPDMGRKRGTHSMPRSHRRRAGLGQTRRQRKHRNLLLRHRDSHTNHLEADRPAANARFPQQPRTRRHLHYVTQHEHP